MNRKRILTLFLCLALLVGLLPAGAMAADTEPFHLDESLTREQAAVMTADYLVSIGYARGTRESAVNLYTDGSKISDEAETGVAMVTRLGIMQGGADGAFSPDEKLTQEQSAQILASLTAFLEKDRALNQQAQQLCADMTIDEKIGQVLFVNFRSWKDEGQETISGMQVLSSEVESIIKKYHLGNVILFSENTKTTADTARLTADLQSAARAAGDLPLLIGIDQEGGIVTRLGQGTCLPGNMALGAAANPQYAYQEANVIGEELTSLGINCDLAPSVDVNDNPANPVIGLRSFGSDPQQVSVMARQYLLGLKSTGTIGCAKHFPGHGNTAVNTHTGLAMVNKTRAEWARVEAIPFQTLIASGVDMVMSAHIQNPGLDSTQVISKSSGNKIYLPATLSHTVLTEVLRGELGFDGVISTDAMDMAAITDNFGETQAVVMALQAGANLLCNPTGMTSLEDVPKLEAIYQAIRTAVTDGSLPQTQLDEVVTRVLKLKLKSGIIGKDYPTAQEQAANAANVVSNAAHRATERIIAEAAVTLYDGSYSPIRLKAGETVLFAVPYENEENSVRFAVNRLKAEGAISNITVKVVCYQKATQLSDETAASIKAADHVVVLSKLEAAALKLPDHWLNAIPQEILSAARDSGKTDSAVVSVGLPYDAANYPGVPVYLVYGYIDMSEHDAASGAITGKYGPNIPAGIGCVLGAFAPKGKLPVSYD